MKSNKFRKTLAIGIIILFIGTSAIPIISGSIKNQPAKDTIKNNDDDIEIISTSAVIKAKETRDNTIMFNFYFEKPEVSEEKIGGQLYHSVNIPGLPKYGASGEPVLPMKTVKVLIPNGKHVSNIKVNGDKNPLPGTYIIEPGQKAYPTDIEEESEPAFTLPNKAVYASDFPGVLFDSEIQLCSGYKLLLLTLYPFHTSPSLCSYYSKMTLIIELKDERSATKNYRGGDKDRIKDLDVLNLEARDTYQKVRRSDENISYVIITTEDYKDVFQELATWKETRGSCTPYENITTRVVLLANITSNSSYWYDGYWGDGGDESIFNDTQCQIRNFIKMAYNNWNTDYVLLGGDADEPVIPHRLTYSDYSPHYSIPCDMYFGCLDGNWDNDSDGIFGEGGNTLGGEGDFFAEVYIGRAPVDNLIEAYNFVNKTIAYEIASANRESYLKNALMIGGYLDDITEGGNSKDAVTKIIPQYTTIKNYNRDGTFDESRILEEMENGVHIINYNGHSSRYFFTTPSPNLINKQDVTQLTNDKYFLIYSQGCNSAEFDYNDAIGETFVTASGGAFAYIGNSRYGWYQPGSIDGPGDKFDRSFFQTLMNQTLNAASLGKALQYSKEQLWSEYVSNKRYMYFTLNLLGDPETKIETSILAPTARFETLEEISLFPPTYNGTVEIFGTAMRGNAPDSTFTNYSIEYGMGVNPDTWSSDGIMLADDGGSEVIDGILGWWDTTQLSLGPYTLRLTVYDGEGRIGQDWFVVMIANTPSVYNRNKETYFTNIQAAVNNADLYDTIYVYNRIYYECVIIDKPLTLIGEDKSNTIIDGYGIRHVVQIPMWVNGVSISNFTIQHSGIDCSGINVKYSNNDSISENIIANNSENGIMIGYSSRINISRNTIINNEMDGIYLEGSSENNIDGNTITDNKRGIHFEKYGSYYSKNNIVSRNTIAHNVWNGICLSYSSHNNITYNTIAHNVGYGMGIKLQSDSCYNTIFMNNIVNNTYGIYLHYSSNNNLIYHNNFFYNSQSAYDECDNIWDDGYPSGGNYWSNYQGSDNFSGPDQNESGGDGICDTPYNISGRTPPNQDRYPLMTTYILADANGPYEGVVDEPIQFTGSVFAGIPPYSWYWDFGDSNTSNSRITNHPYSLPGTYTVTLTVTDSQGNSDNDITIATVEVPELVADAQGPSTGLAGEPLHFLGSATGGFPPYSWHWDFGDGNTSNEQNTTHNYTEADTYTVTLTVTDNEGYSDTAITIVTIAEELVANAHGPYEEAVDELIQFTGSATGGFPQYSWHWDFGDDTKSTEQSPVHNYSEVGEYTVTLDVTDSEGNTVNNITTVTILVLRVDAHGPYEELVAEPIQFNGSVIGGQSPYTWHWDFGDGNTSDKQNPTHNYSAPGIYTITVMVTDRQNNSDNDSRVENWFPQSDFTSFPSSNRA